MSFASRVLTHRTIRRRHLLGLALLSLLILWGAAWITAAFHLNKAVDRWVNASKINGINFTFSDRSTDGTPFTVHVHLDDFFVKLPSGSHEVRAGEAVLYADLWDWYAVSTKLRNTIDGTIAGLPFSADVLKIGFAKPENLPMNGMETGFSVFVQSLGLTFKPQDELPLGNRLEQLSFDLRVMGTPPDFTKTEAVRAWNDAGGVLEFDQLDLLWGPLGLSAKGTVGLNSKLQPEGAFSGKVEGLDDAVNVLVSKDIIEQRQEALLRSSISILARPSSVMGGSAPIIPISVQNGGLFLGPVRVMTIPQLDWPEEPAAAQDSL